MRSIPVFYVEQFSSDEHWYRIYIFKSSKSASNYIKNRHASSSEHLRFRILKMTIILEEPWWESHFTIDMNVIRAIKNAKRDLERFRKATKITTGAERKKYLTAVDNQERAILLLEKDLKRLT